MSMRLFPGRVSLRRRPGAQARQALVLGLCCLTGGQAWALNEVALNCSFGNGKGLPWRVVNELTSGTAKGTVLFARPVSLFLNYKPQASQEAHELVIGGNWSGVGFPGPYGTVASDVKGIGYRISVDAQDGVKRVIPVDNQPHALDKRVTSFSGSTTSDYLQELVLTVDPGELPAGDLKVTSVSGSATLNLWAVDRLKGEASIGSVLAVPADNYPTGVCRKPYSLIGPASIGIGDPQLEERRRGGVRHRREERPGPAADTFRRHALPDAACRRQRRPPAECRLHPYRRGGRIEGRGRRRRRRVHVYLPLSGAAALSPAFPAPPREAPSAAFAPALAKARPLTSSGCRSPKALCISLRCSSWVSCAHAIPAHGIPILRMGEGFLRDMQVSSVGFRANKRTLFSRR